MTKHVLVVDYGVGNLLSVCRAFEACSAVAELSGNPARIAAAERLVVPGVGAFGDCMGELRKRDLIKPIMDYIGSGAPVLGICVGMQMLMQIGEEFGEHEGLGVVPGRVRAIPGTRGDGTPHKIPHIGWSALDKPNGNTNWDGTILEGIAAGQHLLFRALLHRGADRRRLSAGRLRLSWPPHLGCAARRQRLRHAVPSREERRDRLAHSA